jgi:hypothetical protein
MRTQVLIYNEDAYKLPYHTKYVIGVVGLGTLIISDRR